jgi:hypothetical protein
MPDYTITPYGNRFFALYSKRQCATDGDGDDLLAVTVYKKGAQRILDELTRRDSEIAKRAQAPQSATSTPIS